MGCFPLPRVGDAPLAHCLNCIRLRRARQSIRYNSGPRSGCEFRRHSVRVTGNPSIDGLPTNCQQLGNKLVARFLIRVRCTSQLGGVTSSKIPLAGHQFEAHLLGGEEPLTTQIRMRIAAALSMNRCRNCLLCGGIEACSYCNRKFSTSIRSLPA